MGPDELFQRAVIARRYYIQKRTMVQIAEEFGLSRFKVSRMLDEALDSGMVEITIHSPGSIDVELSTSMQRIFGLEHAYAVVADSNNADDIVESVAAAMAELLQSILREGDVIGVDCGRTITHVAGHLARLPRCDVVQLTGMAGEIASNGTDLVRRISEVSGGRSWPLYAPLVVSDARTAKGLLDGAQIRETFAHHANVTCALVSIGAWNEDSSQVYSSLSAPEAAELEAAGVCAETCALTVDVEGRRVPGLDDRRIGVREDTLRATPTVIAVATGESKVAATRAVLRSGLVSSLVADARLAAAVVKMEQG